MGLWKLTLPSYGTLQGGHTFLFSTEETFCQKLLYHIVAMMVLKRFRIVTHCYAASFFIKTLFCKTNNISTARKPNIRQKQIIILKVHHGGKFSKFCLRQQLFAFKRFCMETRLLNISKTTNVIDFIKTILKSPCRFLLDNAI